MAAVNTANEHHRKELDTFVRKGARSDGMYDHMNTLREHLLQYHENTTQPDAAPKNSVLDKLSSRDRKMITNASEKLHSGDNFIGNVLTAELLAAIQNLGVAMADDQTDDAIDVTEPTDELLIRAAEAHDGSVYNTWHNTRVATLGVDDLNPLVSAHQFGSLEPNIALCRFMSRTWGVCDGPCSMSMSIFPWTCTTSQPCERGMEDTFDDTNPADIVRRCADAFAENIQDYMRALGDTTRPMRWDSDAAKLCALFVWTEGVRATALNTASGEAHGKPSTPP